MINSRALVVTLFILLLFAGLTAKLADIQIFKSEELKYYAGRQHTKLETIKAERGFIYDRNNVLMVYNRNDVTFYLDLRMLPEERKNELAKRFSSAFGKSTDHYLNLMKQSGKTICIEKKVALEKAKRLQDLKISALFSVEEPTRVYQYNSLASHVLGYVNSEYIGTNGVGKSYDDILNGEEGSRLVERDAMGGIIMISDEETKAAVPGDNLILTIDKRYQTILEEELKFGLTTYKGESATGIIMDPNTGDIIALANIDDFDPNFYWKYTDYQRKNRAITDTYEPGSTIKAITLAALIDAGKCNEDDLVFVENGRYKFGNTYIKDTHKNAYLTVRGVLEESSNIGISKLIQQLDDDTYYKYLRGFGFGTYTSVTLPGEVKGTLKKPNNWSNYTKTFMSFGYEVSVTPLQLIAAYAAILNGGVLLEPHILKEITDKEGNVKFESSSKIVRRVITKETSERITRMLRGTVKNGTGSLADIKAITVGGKTGTSQKFLEGSYSKSKYNASFVGFLPADDPKLVCLIIVNAPQVEKYGGRVAAPMFRKIAERILEIDLKKFQKSESYNENELVEKNIITTDMNYGEESEVISIINVENTGEITKASQFNIMPDLRGRSVKEALVTLNLLGVRYSIDGSGIVTSQSITPGIRIQHGQICKLTCSETKIIGANIY